MKVIHHEYTKWEDYQNGMFSQHDKSDEEELIKDAIYILSNPEYFDLILSRVFKNWKYSKEENLSNPHANRRAWLGQAACCYDCKVPEVLTRKAWAKLTGEQRFFANKVADKYINGYEEENRRLYKDMGGKMLF